jgi:hypothetical protein
MDSMTASLGEQFARAMASKDHDQIRALLHPELDFQAMTPRRIWDANGPEDVLTAVGTWFDENDHIEAVESIETDSFADRQRVGYRFRVRNADGPQVVEQQAYLSERDGKIGWLRVMCAGYRPAP